MLSFLKRYDNNYPYVSNFAILAFCGYTITWYLQVGYRVSMLGEIRFEFIYAAFLILLAFFTTDKLNLDCPVIKGIQLLFLVMIIQIPFSHDFEISWNIFIDRVIKFSFMAVFIVCYVRSPKQLLLFIGAFLLACMKMGQEGMIGQITGNMVWENQGVLRLHGSTPLYTHPNSFSGMAIGTLPFVIYIFPIANKFFKTLLLLQLVFALNIVLYTGSRTGYVAFLGFLFLFSLKSKKKMKIFILLLVIAAIIVPRIEEQYIQRFTTIFTGEEIEGASMDARRQILEDAIKIFTEYPFGVGVAAFPTVRMRTFGRSQDTHNLYLEVATNLGIQGLIVFFYFTYLLMTCLTNIQKQIIRQKEKINKDYDSLVSKNGLNEVEKHLNDLNLIENISKAVYFFIAVRLFLGLFGMDLYEIYWWFSSGLTVSLFSINRYSEIRTEKLIDNSTSTT